MPKHFIYPLPNPDGTNADRRIELGWQREQYVQIATTAWKGEGKPDGDMDFLPGTATGTASNGDLLRAWAGEFVDLTREQINHLIVQLRAARDQAFGRDQ